MKNITAVLLVLLSVGLASAQDHPAMKLVFERDSAIYLAKIDGSGAKKIADGQSPDLSADGTKVTFDTVQAGDKPGGGQIAVMDLASGAKTIFKDLSTNSCVEPTWSPEGTQILFSIGALDKRHLGLVNADGSGFRDLQKGDAAAKEYWSQTWAADGKSIYAQDMENLYQLDLNAQPIKTWKLEKTFAPGGSMSSSCRIQASPDGKTLLIDVEMDEEARTGWDGPPPAVWTLDLATNKATRLTPKKLYGYNSQWLDAPSSIIFVSINPGEENTNIYRMSTGSQGKDKKLLVKNAMLPAVSP